MAETPESDAVVERIRQFCDEGIRYFTWALRRMPSISPQAVHAPTIEDRRLTLAQILAFVEGATDARAATLAARDEIVPRFIGAVDDENWSPTFVDGPSPDAT